MDTFYSNGKLLLTGEYVVLDGAKALAIPTKYGQNLYISPSPLGRLGGELIWESYTDTDELWLQVVFDLPRLRIINATFDAASDGGNDALAEKLQEILLNAKKMTPIAIGTKFLSNEQGFLVKSKLTFPRNWGLGSSSTLINNIAQWAKIDAFQLQFQTFGGSGYDIACAQNNSPIIYQLKNKKPLVEVCKFNPPFKGQLYFVYLNKKQNSREGIAAYKKLNKNNNTVVDEISQLTQLISACNLVTDFEKLLAEHETIISKIIGQKPIQELLFSDYFGQTKSLGAWGGDFILATGNENTPNYFKQKGFETVIPYSGMVLE